MHSNANFLTSVLILTKSRYLYAKLNFGLIVFEIFGKKKYKIIYLSFVVRVKFS